jgi:pSer/pThr/pTyr-binding forkhead associated (FHA) protein
LKSFGDISSSHCKVYLSNNQFLIDDLDSTNGTFLNGAKVIQKCPISSGDELTLGANKFKIFIREN